MDRTSRFQNPMPLTAGDFEKPLSIQSDGVGIKPLAPSILDRFRALVKDREDELRLFGGRAVLPLSTPDIVRIYEIVLSELTINSKPIITDLTIIAGEQRAHCEGIADAISVRIIEVSVDKKLPSLYLLDSIVKNIGKEYIRHFSVRLPEVFCEAYTQVQPNMHRAMRHLFRTWSTVIPLSVLQNIEAQLQFSPSVNGQSSSLSSSIASESPRPAHGIHINPKYLEAQHKFGHSTINTAGNERLSSICRAGIALPGIDPVKRSLPLATGLTNRIMLGGPLSPSLEEFGVDSSPKRINVMASPSHPGMDHGLTRVMSRENETSEWQKRKWLDDSNLDPKASVSHKHSNGVDLSGPRALISAYGMDEREKKFNRNHPLDSNEAGQKIGIRTWQNTEEEEFDWEDITPALPDRKQYNEKYSSLPPVNSLARQSLTTNSAAPLMNSYSSKLAKSSHGLPHQDPQSHFNGNGSVSVSGAGNFLNAGGQNLPLSDRLTPNDSPAPEIRPDDSGKFHSSGILPLLSDLPPQMQIRGQFGLKSTAHIGVDESLNKHLGGNGIVSQVGFPKISIPHPGVIPTNPQNIAQASAVHPNMTARQNVPTLSFIPPLSIPTVQPFRYGHFPRAHGPSMASSNLVPGVHSSFPMLNVNISRPPFHPRPGSPFPGTIQALPAGQVAPIPFSGLLGSLMAQGLISGTKQDSIGVDFDQDNIRVRLESPITALYGDLPRQCKTCGRRFKDQDDHSKHMDWHVSKNRTLKNRKTKPPPKWFVSASMWLTGAEAMGTEAAPGFSPVENPIEKNVEEEMAVPADEEQHACALCGEPFEDFYSDEMEEWMYKGAVYMHAPDGSAEGMDRSQLGPIVHAKCRSDSIPSEDLRNNEGEDDSRRKRLQS